MPAPRRLVAVSLALAALTVGGCARTNVQAVPTVPWEAPEVQPASVPTDLPAPAPEPTPQGTVPTPEATPTPEPTPAAPTPEPAPSAEPTPSSAPTPSAQPTAEPTRAPAARATTAPTRPARPAAGPAVLAKGASGDEVRDLQARLTQLNWFSGTVTGYYGPATATAVANFQSKRGLTATGAVDQGTLTTLRSMTRQPSKAELGLEAPRATSTPGQQATGLDPRCMTGRALCISKRTNRMTWVIDGKVQDSFSVRFGSKELPTREGSFSVEWKSRDHVSNLYHTPMPYALFFSGGQAVHYSPDFAARGYNGASHGCVNVRDKGGMQALFGQVRVGDKVIVHR